MIYMIWYLLTAIGFPPGGIGILAGRLTIGVTETSLLDPYNHLFWTLDVSYSTVFSASALPHGQHCLSYKQLFLRRQRVPRRETQL
jgi:hypothetical protein